MAAPRLSLPAGTELLWFETLDSTNEEARRRAAAGFTGPAWIVAERQTQGRGRRGRSWDSASGNLTATYLFAPKLPPGEAARLSFAACLAVADLIGPPAQVKWPNDVLLNGRKVAGILLESAAGAPAGAVSWLAIGIGVNLRNHPDATEFPATSLVSEGLSPPALSEAMEQLAAALDRWLAVHAREGFEPIRRFWLARGPKPGTPLKVRIGAETVTGTFADLSGEGALMLREEGGALRAITAGDVFFGQHGERP